MKKINRCFSACFLLITLVACNLNSKYSKEVLPPSEAVPSGSIERLFISSEYVQKRAVDVWLPANYPNEEPYDVLYMHDGEALFGLSKPNIFNNAEWKVDEVLTDLMSRQMIRPTIVVGAYNAGIHRFEEYFPEKALPFIDKKNLVGDFKTIGIDSCKADRYLRFMVEEVKSYVDAHYEVRKEREHTFVMGSSMGGLISMYAQCEYPMVFGGAACLSTHWTGLLEHNDEIPDGIISYMRKHLPPVGSNKFYFDYGTLSLDSLYAPYQKRVDKLMKEEGYSSTHWQTLSFPGEDHSPKSWSKRLDIPFRFLLGNGN